ncbi:hypothetical protein GF361_04355 [Candidatus Woesearchaeota archaeon]|nr:hypothetical protein [Candidatus Woesearchaeota archaeon]
MNNKAQEARNDLVVWYVVCLVVVLVSVSALYGFGFLNGDVENGSLIEDNKVTGAAVAVPVEKNNGLNNSNDISNNSSSSES